MYETVLERFPGWVFGEFYRSLRYEILFENHILYEKVISIKIIISSMFATFLGERICSYLGELESLGQG